MDLRFNELTLSKFYIFGFYCLALAMMFVRRQNVYCLKRFTRYEHYAGEVEEIIIGRLASVS